MCVCCVCACAYMSMCACAFGVVCTVCVWFVVYIFELSYFVVVVFVNHSLV